jgi:chaperone required for assembly of F1-ATPase
VGLALHDNHNDHDCNCQDYSCKTPEKSFVKRFWHSVTVSKISEKLQTSEAIATHVSDTKEIWGIFLDDRLLKTPRGALFHGSKDLIHLAAKEWLKAGNENIERIFSPKKMLVTNMINTSIDHLPHHRDAVINHICSYSLSDTLCYRVQTPELLREKQIKHWDPIIEWCKDELGIPLNLTFELCFVEQPTGTCEKFSLHLSNLPDIQLSALHNLVAYTGSLVLIFAIFYKRLTEFEAWEIAHLEEICCFPTAYKKISLKDFWNTKKWDRVCFDTACAVAFCTEQNRR